MVRGTTPKSGFRGALALAALLALPGTAAPQAPGLSLADAVEIARRNNPAFLSVRNDAGPADWDVRQAYAGILPTASASVSGQYQAPGTPNFGIFTADELGIGKTPSYYYSSYRLGLNLSLSPGTLFEMRRARAARQATDATIDAQGFQLASEVTVAYLSALRARDAVVLTERQVAEAEATLESARARVEVGEAIPLEERQAQVGHGRAQVALLRARNLEETELNRLAQQLGVQLPADVSLTSEFEVFEPQWSAEALVAEAMAAHPQLVAARASASAARAGLRQQQGNYLPSLSLSAAWSGFARETGDPDRLIQDARDQVASSRDNCEFWNRVSSGLSEPLPGRPQNCSEIVLTPDMEQRILERNDAFPFDWNDQPLTVTATVSLPIFTGFSRQLQVAQARNRAEDAEYQRRAAELEVRTRVAERLSGLRTAYDTYQIELQNHEAAEGQVDLARERYRLGAGTFLDLLNAQAIQAQADGDLLNARYSFHEQLVALEAAVGRPLERR